MTKKERRTVLRAAILAGAYTLIVSLVFWGIYSVMGYPFVSGEATLPAASGTSGGEESTAVPAKKETPLRAVWVATVANIDFPSRPGLTAEALAKELDDIVREAHSLGANAIFFQVRPSSDALYDSRIFPVSGYLSGERGRACDSGFDPLSYLIAAAENEGIAVHAWVNPMRVLSGSAASPASRASLCPNEPAALHPDWVKSYPDGKLYFDVGIPEVRTLIADGVGEIVRRYRVAGVVFDDYFYPYPVTDASGAVVDFDDADSYAKYGGGRARADFRRENVNALIRKCGIEIKKADKSCLFGVSPFGIWQNAAAGTRGLDAYSTIYCDALAFAREGTVDYLAPQLYWSFDTSAAPFGVLADWWSSALSGTGVAFVPCLGAYRCAEEGGYTSGELARQLLYTEALSGFGGWAVYGLSALRQNAIGCADELRSAWLG